MGRTLLAITALALIAASCSPGPLPEIPPRHPDYKADWFPTRSENRLPSGQRQVHNFPVLDLGLQPEIPRDKWELKIHGHVERR